LLAIVTSEPAQKFGRFANCYNHFIAAPERLRESPPFRRLITLKC